MAEASIPVDLLNPGQVFACLGFVEAADKLLGEAHGAFDWSSSGDTRFLLHASGDESPIEVVLRFLSRAEVVAEAPHGSELVVAWNGGWGRIEMLPEDAPYPFAEPTSPATLVAVLRAGAQQLVIHHWGDETRGNNAKFWAGAGGYPGAGLARDALALVRDRAPAAAADPFAVEAPQSSSFRLDWRRDYIPIDAGFSLNKHHGKIQTVGFPLVEVLGALGLGHARPEKIDRLSYRYGVVGRETHGDKLLLPPSIVRAALGASALPFPSRRFRMSLGWPGKEGQARAITTVIEESRA